MALRLLILASQRVSHNLIIIKRTELCTDVQINIDILENFLERLKECINDMSKRKVNVQIEEVVNNMGVINRIDNMEMLN